MISNDINGFDIENFGVRVKQSRKEFFLWLIFKRSNKGTRNILISYNLMCAMLVMISLVNFLIEPKDTNRAAILIALILVLATIFNTAEVFQNIYTQLIFICKKNSMELTILFSKKG